MSKVADFSGTAFALAFGEADVTLLVRRACGESWERLDRAAFAAAHPDAAMARMRGCVPGDGEVHVFLPPEHVATCHVRPGGRADIAAQVAAHAGCDADSLAITHWRQPSTGRHLAVAADRTTIREAADHAASWGFKPVTVGVHPDTMPEGAAIRFPFEPPRPARAPVGIAAAVGALVLLGMAVLGFAPDRPADPVPTLSAAGDAVGGGSEAGGTGSVGSAAVRSATGPGPSGPIPGPIEGPEAQAPPVLSEMGQLALPAPPRASATPRHLSGGGGPQPDRAQPERMPPDRMQPGRARPPITHRGPPSLPPAMHDERQPMRSGVAAMPRPESAVQAAAPVGAVAAAEEPVPVRLAALTQASTPTLSDAQPLVATDPADPPDDEAVPLPPDAAQPPATSGTGEAWPRRHGDSADAPAPDLPLAGTAAAPSVPRVASLAPIDGPRSFAPRGRPDGMVTPTWRARAAAPRSPRPQPRPAGLAASHRTRASPTVAPPEVAALATVAGTFSEGQAGLLGIITLGNRREAILVLPSGEITRVGNGDRVDGWTVAAINDDYVRLTGSGERRTLRLLSR